MTSIRKTLLIGASSLAIALTAASANAGYNDHNNNDDPSLSIDDSFNKDIDIYKKTEVDVEVDKDDHSINDSFNKDIEVTNEYETEIEVEKTEIDVDIDKDDHSVNDSFNRKEYTKNESEVEDSYNVETEDSFNHKLITKDSFNTTSSKSMTDNRASQDDDKFILKGKDVTASVLEGTVANNSVALKMGNKGDIAGNWIGDYVQQNADGVNLNLQNVGSNSNNQQAVTIRADVYNTDSLTMGETGNDHGGGMGGGYGGGWQGGRD